MAKVITDRALLGKIYKKYYDQFCSYNDDTSSRSSKIYVPIDCDALAIEYGIDSDLVFGRLYYHLDKKYGYKDDDGVRVPLFSTRAGSDWHVVNFPLLAAILADMEESNFRFMLPIILSSTALAISILSFAGISI